MSLHVQPAFGETTVWLECDERVHDEIAVLGKCGLNLALTAKNVKQAMAEAREQRWAVDYSSKRCKCPKHRSVFARKKVS